MGNYKDGGGGGGRWRIELMMMILVSAGWGSKAIDIYLDWDVALDTSLQPVSVFQPVITINGMFPGPLINATTNDFIHVNVHNNLDEDLLFTWNGIQQRLNSWQDGVSGTNCGIKPGTNWTYVFQTKDQIGSFFYFPSINYQKAAGGYGPIRVNNRNVINVPFDKPDAEFDLLIGDWSYHNYKATRSSLNEVEMAYHMTPDTMLINGKGPYGHPMTKDYQSFTVTKGMTYRFRISNVGSALSFNLQFQNHSMVLVETEGSYTSQISVDSLDVHVGQSYSVLVTADEEDEADYYITATPKMLTTDFASAIVGKALLHYSNSTTQVGGGPPNPGPDPFDLDFSVNQAKSIRWNMTAGAARPNPQGTFNVSNVTISETYILENLGEMMGGVPRYEVNNVSYYTLSTPLKLADHFLNGSGVYQINEFPTQSVNAEAALGVSVVSPLHKGWLEIVFKNNLDTMDSWHLDGFGFYVVGYGDGEWNGDSSRDSYNLYDPVVRSTVQVYPGEWSAVYAFLDNPGMWNLRSQHLNNWYLGQELYLRVHDPDPNPAKERPPPQNLLLCGIFDNAPSPTPIPAPWSGW